MLVRLFHLSVTLLVTQTIVLPCFLHLLAFVIAADRDGDGWVTLADFQRVLRKKADNPLDDLDDSDDE